MPNDYDPWPLADAAKEKEKAEGLSYREAAKQAGLKPGTWWNISRGGAIPRVDHAFKAAKWCGFPLGDY